MGVALLEPLGVAIPGAGAIGSRRGGLLADAGHRVTLVVIDDAHRVRGGAH